MNALDLAKDFPTDRASPATSRDVSMPATFVAWDLRGSLYSLGGGCVGEIRETVQATFGPPVRLFQYLSAWRRTRSLKMAFSAAQLALGQRMYAAGIDDGQYGMQISRLDAEIIAVAADGSRTKANESERKKLLRHLAASALEEEAPLPGADREYASARKFQKLLAKQAVTLNSLSASLRPKDRAGWKRIAVGVGTITLFSLLAIARVWG